MKPIGLFKAMSLCMKYKKLAADEREKLRNQRLAELIAHAKDNSPYFKNLYKDVTENFTLSHLPPTNKRDLMEHWNDWVCDPTITLHDVEAFMEDKSHIGSLFNKKYLVFTTSGSTGNPLVAIYDKTANNVMGGIAACRSYARKEDLIAFMKQGKRTMGIFADEGFYLANSSILSKLKSMPWKKKQLAISSALRPISEIVEELNAFQPVMLGGYPSHLELLIDEAKSGRLHISPVIIMTGGEYLSDELRAKLAETFDCYVQTSYSCTEGGTVACECREKHFHINDDWLIVEPVDHDGNPVADGVLSDKLYLTNLYNYSQPYIRYEVMDRIVMHHEPCPCGNPSPWIEIEGRTDDVTSFTTSDSTVKIAPLALYAVLKEVKGIRRFQVYVYPENRIELAIEESESADRILVFEKAKAALSKYLETLGVLDLTIILSDQSPRQHPVSGKFKHIINMQK